MKREKFIFLLLLLFVIPLASSLDINMEGNISQGETVIATIQGNFLDAISSDNIEFYRGHVRTPFVYDVGNIDGIYYIYFQTSGKTQSNYSIIIKGVRYYVGSSISNDQISKNFTITSEQADFSVNTGFVVTNGNFSIEVQNLNPNTITISIDTEVNSGSSSGFFDFLFKNEPVSNSGQGSVTLLSGEIEEIDISIDDIDETTVRTLTLSSENTLYEIPVQVILQSKPNNTSSNDTENINETIDTDNNDTEYKNETEDNVSFWDLFKKPNQTTNDSNAVDDNEDYDIVVDDQGNEHAVDNTGQILDVPASSKECSELNGVVCSSNQICQNETSVYAKDAKCCLSSCVKKSTGKTGKIVGWIIIGFILLLIIWFKIKFSKTKRKSPDFLSKK